MRDYLGPMRWMLLMIVLCAAACDPGGKDLCKRSYQPYPDYLSDRTPTKKNEGLLDAMRAYSAGDYAAAIPGLQQHIDTWGEDDAVRMYLASANLGAGDPYKAEMHLDHLENSYNKRYSDQVDWYNALCWLCEGDADRALKQVQWIAARPKHTYHEQAEELVHSLSER